MAEKIGVVLIDGDEGSRQFFKELARGTGPVQVAGETPDPGRGYDMVRQMHPAIVVLDLYPSAEVSLRLAEKIIQQYPQIVLFVTSFDSDPEIIIKAMRAGAREFLAKPLRKEDVENALKAAVRFLNRRAMGESRNGKLISVFGVKGGVGATTVAANLAAALAGRPKREVVLVDMNLQFGNAALFLNLNPRNSIIDVAEHIAEIDPAALRQSLLRHDSGVSLLAGPARIEDAEMLQTGQLETILTLLRAAYDYIIIDLPKHIDDLTMKALDASDVVLTVFTTDIPAISNTLRCIEVFKRLDYGNEKVLPVINRYNVNSGPALDELQKSLKYPIFWKIPNQDYTTIISSINQGKLLASTAPRSAASQSFVELANRLNGAHSEQAPEEKSRDREGLLKRLFKK